VPVEGRLKFGAIEFLSGVKHFGWGS
jgi:hypothetical protein